MKWTKSKMKLKRRKFQEFIQNKINLPSNSKVPVISNEKNIKEQRKKQGKLY